MDSVAGKNVKRDLAKIVCCPIHKSELVLNVIEEEGPQDILTGTLHCKKCKFDFPIEAGIPNLLPPEYHQ